MSGKLLRTDWVINWPTIISILTAAMGVAFWVYGAIKELDKNVGLNKAAADQKFAEYDRQWATQKATDEAQDQRIIRAFSGVGDQIRELRQDIRADLRDLRGTRLPAVSQEAPRVIQQRERERGG